MAFSHFSSNWSAEQKESSTTKRRIRTDRSVTLPPDVMEALNANTGDVIEFIIGGPEVRLRKWGKVEQI